ncbi:modification methylase [Vibrio parahaemolyticus]|uniref:adenine-specific methyltransferase EcoRI family protein n=1 Tax=Vibrio vulnificus TaxID=672 RepID=UPI000CD063A8|nr:adenine-specific methyltransferase EcoRI family protein [Vibrio vulnificus]EHH1037322.1 modification methylase [Vibrio parahaemolyticus]MCU8395505.1 adenine-specific methyltransferase EcoRI family protein [Vibrio vulnificus]POC14554.1 modification methylase [Vibrio vulnificus]
MTKDTVASTRNRDFQQARDAKKDEFYTSLYDIELELEHYKKHFDGKIVYCNCDDPRASNFFRYFSVNFERLGLKKLITTCYRSQDAELFGSGDSDEAVYLEYVGNKSSNGIPSVDKIGIKRLNGDGDFRSAECVELLKQADIVVTNPPFSLFKEYVAQLVKHNKKFVIIGNMNAVTYTSIFPLIQNNQMWYGPSIRSGDREFRVPANYPITASGFRVDQDGNKYVRVKGVRWFTNLDYPSRHVDLELHSVYSPDENPKYANYDAIEVGKTKNIPRDYDGPMGVPITFLDKFNPDQFEILGSSKTLSLPMSQVAEKGSYQQGGPRFYLPKGDGTFKRMYERIVIRKKSSDHE